MLDLELVPYSNIERAKTIFTRDGFVAISGALSQKQLSFVQSGAQRVIAEQTNATSLEFANRGYARYSFGQQVHQEEWATLIDLPTVLPILEAIWSNHDFTATGAGGDYSLPGAKIQPLHSDMFDPINDPLSQVSIFDMPTPFIVVNFLLTDFTEINGAIRLIPGTQRSRLQPPQTDNEPRHWRESVVCAPQGTAIIRDARCWHGGTSNRSDSVRIMASTGYYAPWFRQMGVDRCLPVEKYKKMSKRAQLLCRGLVDWESLV